MGKDNVLLLNKSTECNCYKQDILSKCIGTLFFVLLVLIVCSKFFYVLGLVPVIIACVFFIILSLFIIAFNKSIKVKRLINSIYLFINRFSYKKLLFFIVFVSLASKIIAIIFLKINSIDDHSDINVYITSSKELADNGFVNQYADYCFSFSHMFWFAVFLSPITKIFGVSQVAYSLFFSILLTVVVSLLFDILSCVCNKNIAFVTVIVYLLLPTQILLPQYITHEIAALFFLSISLWLYFRVYKELTKSLYKIFVFVGVAVSLLFCSAVNSLGLVAVIAFAIVFIIELCKKCSIKYLKISIIKVFSLIIIIVVGTSFLNMFQINHSQLNHEDNSNKMLWTLYVGSNYESQGQWFPDKKWHDYPDDYSSLEVELYHKDLVWENYKQLFSEPVKIFSLLKCKMINIWGDFTYSLGMTNETIPNEDLRGFFNKILFKPLSMINYFILLIVAIIGCFKKWKTKRIIKNDFLIFCELFLLGTTTLLLITECRNKYTIMILPFFIVACFAQTKETKDIIQNR